MQVTVSSKNKPKSCKVRIKSVITTILIFLFAIISSTVLIVQKKKLVMFEERIFYFVAASSARKEKDLDTQKELLKNLGGASVIYKNSDKYYLVANVYLDLEAAEEIRDNLKKYFTEAEILKVKTKKIEKSNIKCINSDYNTKNLVKYLYNLSKDYQNLQMDYLQGEISQGSFLSSLSKVRLELENLNKVISSDKEPFKTILASSELIGLGLTNFLSNFELSASKQNYICNYFVGFYINYIEMVNCL